MIYSNIQENGEIELLKFCLKIGNSFRINNFSKLKLMWIIFNNIDNLYS